MPTIAPAQVRHDGLLRIGGAGRFISSFPHWLRDDEIKNAAVSRGIFIGSGNLALSHACG